MKRLRFSLILGSVCLFSLPCLNAFAQDSSALKSELVALKASYDIVRSDAGDRYASDLKEVSNWLDESPVRIEKGEYKTAQLINTKASVYLDYVAANLQKDVAVAEADAAENKLREIKAEHGRLEAEVQQLQAEETLLQEELNKITKK